MKSIEFRGLVESDSSTWVYGYLMSNNRIYKEGPAKHQYRWDTVIPESVGQYTGCRDKNNIKIYENDIIKDFKEGRCFKVKYENGAFLLEDEDMKLTYLLWSYPLDKLEVIGNSFALGKSGYGYEFDFKGTRSADFLWGLLGLL